MHHHICVPTYLNKFKTLKNFVMLGASSDQQAGVCQGAHLPGKIIHKGTISYQNKKSISDELSEVNIICFSTNQHIREVFKRK